MRSGGILGSLGFIAVGSILYWTVGEEAGPFASNAIGLILLAGLIGLVLTLAIATATDNPDGGGDFSLIDR